MAARELFPGFYKRTKEEYAEAWSRGVIVPDTNVLLHVFRYGPETQREILNVLSSIQSRLHIPYQVAFEFSRRHQDIEDYAQATYEKLRVALRSSGNALAAVYSMAARHPIIEQEKEKEKVFTFIEKLCADIDENEKRHPAVKDRDSILQEVLGLIDGHIESEPEAAVRDALIKTGATRYSAKIPPGYEDANKPSPDCYGEYFIWESMITAAKKAGAPLIFVSDDKKEDWWKKKLGGGVSGPRPELVNEFHKRSGQLFHIYGLTQFLTYAKQHAGATVSDKSIAEVEKEEREDAAAVLPSPVTGDIYSTRQPTTNSVSVDLSTGFLKIHPNTADYVAARDYKVDNSSPSRVAIDTATGFLKITSAPPNVATTVDTASGYLNIAAVPTNLATTLDTATGFLKLATTDANATSIWGSYGLGVSTTSPLTVDTATGYLKIANPATAPTFTRMPVTSTLTSDLASVSVPNVVKTKGDDNNDK